MSCSDKSHVKINQDELEDARGYLAALEREWRTDTCRSLPSTEVGWLEVFPEAKETLPGVIRELELRADNSREEIRTALAAISRNSNETERSFLRAVLKHLNPAVSELAFVSKRIRHLKVLTAPFPNKRVRAWKEAYASARNREMLEVAEHYGIKLRKTGRTYSGLCPLHFERTPSFHIYPPSRFVCFGCGAKGGVIDFVMSVESCTFKEAVTKLNSI